MRSFSFLAFVVLTFCCWGIYGPVLHIGQENMGEGHGKLSSLRPFICVGVAYFLIAVVYPVVMLNTTGEKGQWSASGFLWSFVAGAIGAIGALGIILAFKFQGRPVYVMPLVFGLAPIVNTLVTMIMSGTLRNASFLFYLGILMVAVGAAGVLRFKPSKPKPSKVESTEAVQFMIDKQPIKRVSFVQEDPQAPNSKKQDPAKQDPDQGKNLQEQTQPAEQIDQAANPPKRPVNPKLRQMAISIDESNESIPDQADPNEDDAPKWQDGDKPGMAPVAGQPGGVPPPMLNQDGEPQVAPIAVAEPIEEGPSSQPNLWLIAVCIGITALCWGAYGPVLHKGQAKMEGSRLRPFLCVGLAYFAIAVMVPLFLMGQFPPEPGGWTGSDGAANHLQGAGWSLLAGAAGAVGALGIIYAFNFGGKPVFVMPLVFGFAPVINTLTETFSKNLFAQVEPMFLGSLLMVILGAVIVLVFAPRGPKPQPQSEQAAVRAS